MRKVFGHTHTHLPMKLGNNNECNMVKMKKLESNKIAFVIKKNRATMVVTQRYLVHDDVD
jgi:hypothetical protein